MNFLLLLLHLLICQGPTLPGPGPVVSSGGAGPNISLSQSIASTGTSGVTSKTVIFPSNVATGDLVIVAINWGNSSGTYTISDSASNSYTQFPAVETGTTLNDLNGYWTIHAGSPSALAVTVSIASGGTHTLRVAIYDYHSNTGWPASPVDQSSHFLGSTGVTSGDAGSISPTVTGTLVFSAIQWSGAVSSVSVNSGFAEQTAGGTSGLGWLSDGRADSCDKQAATTSAQNCIFSWTTTVQYSAFVANFKPN